MAFGHTTHVFFKSCSYPGTQRHKRSGSRLWRFLPGSALETLRGEAGCPRDRVIDDVQSLPCNPRVLPCNPRAFPCNPRAFPCTPKALPCNPSLAIRRAAAAGELPVLSDRRARANGGRARACGWLPSRKDRLGGRFALPLSVPSLQPSRRLAFVFSPSCQKTCFVRPVQFGYR